MTNFINLKLYRQGFSLILLSMTLSSCATINRFIPHFNSTEAEFSKKYYSSSTQQSGYHCYSNVTNQTWQCQNQAYPEEALSLSDVGLQERSGVMSATPEQNIPTHSFVEPLFFTPEPKINHKSREILNKPATFFAVQLLALSNEAALHQYAKNKHMADPLYTQIDAKGQHLYVLLLGIYSDQISAKRASQRWTSKGDRTSKPWVRVLGPLQNQIVLASSE
ncbi:MAG: hypothetical protein JKY88_19720 [Pseudomonadales bacterium]|nr:hypothetical protein [Pseudomonadales bacterium]